MLRKAHLLVQEKNIKKKPFLGCFNSYFYRMKRCNISLIVIYFTFYFFLCQYSVEKSIFIDISNNQSCCLPYRSYASFQGPPGLVSGNCFNSTARSQAVHKLIFIAQITTVLISWFFIGKDRENNLRC